MNRDARPIWEFEDLATLAAHEEAKVRAWAVQRMTRRPDAAAVPALLAALGDADAHVTSAALDGLHALRERGVTIDSAALRGALHALVDRGDEGGAVRDATALLIDLGDEAAIEQVIAREPANAPWTALARAAPERVRREAERAGLLTPGGEGPAALVCALPAVITAGELDAALARGLALADEDADLFVESLMERCEAEHLWGSSPLDEGELASGIADQRARHPRAGAAEALARWLSEEAFGPAAARYDAGDHAGVVAWCSAWCAALAEPDGDARRWTLATLDALARRAPGERSARAALTLAVASGERAVEHAVPLATCSVAERFARACGGSRAQAARLGDDVASAWRALAPRDPQRNKAALRFAKILEWGDPLAVDDALELVARLPDFPLPEGFLDEEEVSEEENAQRERCLAAQPEALRGLLATLDDRPEATRISLLAVLGEQSERWAVDWLRERFDALLADNESEWVFGAAEDLADASLLPAVVGAWRPGDELAAEAAMFIAQVNGRVAELPRELVADVGAYEERMDRVHREITSGKAIDQIGEGEPLRVGLRCNRCGREGTYEVGSAIVNPNRARGEAEGWDGVTFERIIECRYCGAEDDYTLDSRAWPALMAGSLSSMLRGEAPDLEALAARGVRVGVAATADGTHIRRASDALKHWQAKVERDPRDAEAWFRLGSVLKRSHRNEAAVAALRRASDLAPSALDPAHSLLDLLLDLGRPREGADLAARVLAALPKTNTTPEDRLDAATAVAHFLREGVRAGAHLGLGAGWFEGVRGKHAVIRASSVDLRRVRDWERLARFLAHPGVNMAHIKAAERDDLGTQLERLLTSDEPIDAYVSSLPEGPPATAQAQPARRDTPKIGRNDPCYCGSGKKFKKCHGR